MEPDLVVRREDLAAAIESYRRSLKSPRQWFLAIGGIALALSLWLGGLLSSSEGVVLASFASGWAVLILLNVWNRRRYLNEVARLGLECPTCAAPILEMIEWKGLVHRADVVLMTGRCLSCGGECFSPNVLTPPT